MQWTKEQIDLLEKLGSAWFSIRKCAAILELDFQTVQRELKDESSVAYKAYYRGWYMSELNLAEGIQKMAARGSNPAQQMARKMLDEAEGRNSLGN